MRIVFDLDATLLNSHEAFLVAKEMLLSTLQSRWPDMKTPVILDTLGRIDAERLVHLGYTPERFAGSLMLAGEELAGSRRSELTTDQRQGLVRAGQVVPSWSYPPFPGTIEVLHWLTAQGAQIGICSKATDVAFQRTKLHRWGLDQLVSFVNIVPHKGPKEIAATLESMGGGGPNPSTDWMVGDSLRDDIHSAAALGIRTIHIQSPINPSRQVKVWSYESGFDHVVPTLWVSCVSHIPEYWDQICQKVEVAELKKDIRGGRRT